MDAKNIELKTFISQSIKDIFDGVIEAQEYADVKKGKVSVYRGHPLTSIKYDVAVFSSIEKTKEGEGGAKIFVASIGIKGKNTNEYSTISRISFTIQVELPNSECVTTNVY